MKIEIKLPNKIKDKDVNDFYKLVKSGGQVNKKTLLARLKKAKLLAFGYADNGKLIAVTSIKVPNKKYQNSVFSNGSINECSENYCYELGYAVTHEEHRGKGYGFILNRELLSKIDDGNIYATTGNPHMVKLLKKLGFSSIGKEYDGNYNKKIQIYSRNIM